jgi:hypothetical protein
MTPTGRTWLHAAYALLVVLLGCSDEVDISSGPPTDGGATGGSGGAAGTTERRNGRSGRDVRNRRSAPDASEPDATESDVTADAAVGIGTPCTANSECATGVCIDEVKHTSYSGGYCTILGCAPATGAGCPPDAVCSGGGAVMNTMCFEQCSPSGTCRNGYACCKADPDAGQVGFCAPSVVPACH